MNILKSISRAAGIQEMTPAAITKLIEEVNDDPLAGLGSLTKKQILVDKLMAQWRIASAQIQGIPVRSAKPILVEEIPPPPTEQTSERLKAAQAKLAV